MPWGDWQFWLATAGALVALWAVARPLLPRRGDADGSTARARPRRTALTIGDTDPRAGRRDVSDAGSRGPARGPPAS
jgi:hypothetical protein